ncbi:hypothetical protein J1614_001008 [Plenodomus biglobosus]|nr:hypothetical protein J1614_001008 [Plenodomus biglobosus]
MEMKSSRSSSVNSSSTDLSHDSPVMLWQGPYYVELDLDNPFKVIGLANIVPQFCPARERFNHLQGEFSRHPEMVRDECSGSS